MNHFKAEGSDASAQQPSEQRVGRTRWPSYPPGHYVPQGCASHPGDEKKAQEFERKLKKDEFTLEDFKEQIKQMKKLGSMESIIGMIPGMNKLKGAIDFSEAENEIKRTEAIINSMTPRERLYPHLIDGSRRVRIAKGSGHRVQDVNDLLKRYLEARKMIKKFAKGGMKNLPRQLLR